MAQILGDIPYHTQLHQYRTEKLRKITRYRIELENLLDKLNREYSKPCFTTKVIEKARSPI
jgi:hypothetical protein